MAVESEILSQKSQSPLDIAAIAAAQPPDEEKHKMTFEERIAEPVVPKIPLMKSQYGTLDRRLKAKAAERREQLIEYGAFGLVLVLLFALIMGISHWLFQRSMDVVNSAQAGEIVSAEFLSSMTEDKTRVETTKGTFLVHGTFQALKGHSASIEERKNGDMRLCDTTTKVCKLLVN